MLQLTAQNAGSASTPLVHQTLAETTDSVPSSSDLFSVILYKPLYAYNSQMMIS